MKNPIEEYERHIEKYQRAVQKLNRIVNIMSTMRLIIFFVGLGASIYLYLNHMYTGAVIIASAFLLFFIILVFLHQHYIDERKYCAVLLEININSQKRIEGKWREFPDTGEEFIDENHIYSGDLDIFGRGSVFQWINTAVTFIGRRKLCNFLLVPPETKNEILRRQEAITELASKLEWRQEFNAEGLVSSSASVDINDLCAWANERNEFYCGFAAKLIFRMLPVFSILMLVLHYTTGSIPLLIPEAAFIVQILLIGVNSVKRSRILGTVSKYLGSIKAFTGMLEALESENFKSEYMKELKNKLIDSNGKKAYIQVKKLDSINSAIANRSFMFYIIFNILFLLDYQFIISLECWKRDSGAIIRDWLDVLGEVEALSSISLIRYENPGWCFPEISEGQPVFSAESMGHPLLAGCVLNSVSFRKSLKVLLITGSNMSGKSTLLRTAGVNLVLAYCGAPVFAKKFSSSIMEIYTCMRIRDDLEKNISSFYAELLRIRKIVEAVKNGKSVFFLLDEIFKGTNSKDRHTGARILIKKLINGSVLGFVSTHDLELADLENESPMIKNYHFQEHYLKNEICFDYRLYPGVSATRNAIYLMKLAGIDSED